MAKNKSKYKEKDEDYSQSTLPYKKPIKTKNEPVHNSITAVILFLIGIFILLASYQVAGVAGEIFFKLLMKIFGFMSYFIWIIFFILGYRYWFRERYKSQLTAISILTIIMMIFALTTFTASIEIKSSGIIGEMFNSILKKNFGDILPSVISLAIFLITFIILYNDRPRIKIKTEKISEINNYVSSGASLAKQKSKNIFKRAWQ